MIRSEMKYQINCSNLVVNGQLHTHIRGDVYGRAWIQLYTPIQDIIQFHHHNIIEQDIRELMHD
jgi:hypothetical protein